MGKKVKAEPKLPKNCAVEFTTRFSAEDFVAEIESAVDNLYQHRGLLAEKIIEKLIGFLDNDDAVERVVAMLNEGGDVQYVKKDANAEKAAA